MTSTCQGINSASSREGLQVILLSAPSYFLNFTVISFAARNRRSKRLLMDCRERD